MSWLHPSAYETEILAEVRQTQPQLVQLAQLTALARTVEPLLLRNLRMLFLPATETELEVELWYSPLVSARSTRNIVLHHGVARLLADELKQEDHWLTQIELAEVLKEETETDKAPSLWQNKLWKLTQKHTQHWTRLEQLEQQLRFYALQDQPEKLQQGIRHILHEITHCKDEKQQLKLARWAKKTLPVVLDSSSSLQETAWLAQYSAEALGSTAKWTLASKPQPIPKWLSQALPAPIPTEEGKHGKHPYQIGVRIYFEAEQHSQIVEFVTGLTTGTTEAIETTEAINILPLTAPLPAQIHISYGRTNRAYIISAGTRIKLKGSSQRIILTTIDGKQYELLLNMAEVPAVAKTVESKPNLYLVYVKEDVSQAHSISEWLGHHDIQVTLVEETPQQTNTGIQDDQAVLLRLWSQAAQQQWKAATVNPEQDPEQLFSGNLLLRTEQTATPLGINPAQIIELPDWKGEEESAPSRQLLAAIHDWVAGTPQTTQASKPHELESEPSDNSFSPEVNRLLKELENSDTQPKRRLEIGDLLDEIGDPRSGVGVREYEIMEYSSEVQTLLNELNTLDTQPPRRLEIGDLLAEMGDPRPGVGLNENGLPDIDWVKIPAGEYMYGESNKRQTLELETYYMSRYPITYQQYQSFIDDGGYQDKEWWKGLNKPEPGESTWQQPNRPKESIDWYEAMAFTRWLSTQLNYKISLPTEHQWEKAARGNTEQLYPWGEKYSSGYTNVDEQENKEGEWYLEKTTAVGVYPQGNTDTGIADLSGNVWEWCLDKYDKSINSTQVDTSGDSRVLRGGSWIDLPVNARATDRGWSNPDGRDDGFGFRVVCVLPFTDR